MPPVMGAAAFLMAENLQVRYAEVALAALVPAMLFYLSVFVQVDFEAAKRKIGGLDPAQLPKAGAVFRAGWFFVIPFVVLIYVMFALNWEAEPAVLAGAAAMVPFAWISGYSGKKLRLAGVWTAIVETGKDAVDLIIICAVAGIVIGLLNITGLALGLSISLVRVGQESLPLLLVLVAIICIVLGMGLPTTGVYLLVAVLAAPALIKLGVPPMAAHMFVFFFGCLSMITPPVAMAAYAAGHIAGASPMKVGWTACRLGWPAFALPFLFAWSPTLLLHGPPLDVVLAVGSALFGTWLGSAALAAHFFEPLGAGRRWLFGIAALLLLLPGHGFAGAGWVDLAGAVLATVLIAREARRRRVARAGAP
jgi:TRAP transporter 4TM/12TM fusion protein